MAKRLMISNLSFGGKPLNINLEIPCRQQLKPLMRSVAIAAVKLARYEAGGAVSYWITREMVEALREFPKVYDEDEAVLIAEAVEVYLRTQLGALYRFIDPEIEWLPKTPENIERVRAAHEAKR